MLHLQKLHVKLTHWENDFSLTVPFENVKAINIRMISYTTATEGNFDMKIFTSSFKNSGYFILNNQTGTVNSYFYSFPLNPAKDVLCTMTNYLASDMDLNFKYPIRTVGDLNLQLFINNLPASDISDLNPVILELGFYCTD